MLFPIFSYSARSFKPRSFTPQKCIISRIGYALLPRSVSVYSTRGGTFGYNGPEQQTVPLQLFELLGQHLLANAGDDPLQLLVPLGPIMKMPQHKAFPLAAEHIHSDFHRAAIFPAVPFDHFSSYSNKKLPCWSTPAGNTNKSVCVEPKSAFLYHYL